MRYLSPFEERLVELVHLLAYGTPEEYGLTVHEIKRILVQFPPGDSRLTVLEGLEESDEFIQKLRTHLMKVNE